MDTVQFAPTGQSKQLEFAFPSTIILLLSKVVDIFRDPLLMVYVPSGQGTHRHVPSFVKCFTLAFTQPINNDEMLFALVSI